MHLCKISSVGAKKSGGLGPTARREGTCPLRLETHPRGYPPRYPRWWVVISRECTKLGGRSQRQNTRSSPEISGGNTRGPKVLVRVRRVLSQGTGLRVVGWVADEQREASSSTGVWGTERAFAGNTLGKTEEFMPREPPSLTRLGFDPRWVLDLVGFLSPTPSLPIPGVMSIGGYKILLPLGQH